MAKKDTSPNKIEANRRNAKKSTGPRSAAGKAKSSRNAVKHGLLAGRIVLADNTEEDPQQFGFLLDELLCDQHCRGWRLRLAYTRKALLREHLRARAVFAVGLKPAAAHYWRRSECRKWTIPS